MNSSSIFRNPRRLLGLAFAAVLGFAGLQPLCAQGEKTQSEEDQKTLSGYHLTTEKVNAFEAVSKKLQAAALADPELKKELKGGGALNRGKNIEETVTNFETQCPRCAAVIKAAGMTVRDYTLTGLSTATAMMAARAKRTSPGRATPSYIPADNLAFAEQNQTRLEAMMQTLAKGREE